MATRKRRTLGQTSKRLNQAAGNKVEAPQAEPQDAIAPAKAEKSKRPPSRQGLKTVCVHVDPAVQKELRYLALDEDTTVQALMVEALNMLMNSRGKPPLA